LAKDKQIEETDESGRPQKDDTCGLQIGNITRRKRRPKGTEKGD